MVTRISSILFAFTLLFFMTASTTFAEDDVTNSKHNLGTGSGIAAWNNTVGGTVGTSATNEVCVFCHTPHQSNPKDMHGAPLWNKALKTVAGDGGGGAYNFMTHAGNLADTQADEEFGTIGAGSIACLSCHDGSQAIDVMINAPGSGGYVDGNGLTGTDLAYDFGTGFDTFSSSNGAAAFIGNNLMNDHPVSILFSEGACQTTTEGDALVDCLEDEEGGFRGAEAEGDHGWHVLDADDNPTEIKIYARHRVDFMATGDGESKVGSVECGSCHNPHLPTTGSAAGGDESLFLRLDGGNAGSQICLTCHIK